MPRTDEEDVKFYSNLSALLKKERLSRGLSLHGMAGDCGTSYQQLQKYESGKNRPTIQRLFRICAAMNKGKKRGKPLPLSTMIRSLSRDQREAIFLILSAVLKEDDN